MASIDDAEDALRSTTPKANFHRLTRLLMHGGVQLLRETFDSIHSPADLPVKLADPTIQAQLRKARLTQPERNRLYPSPGVYGKSSDFDITLIFKLFKKICNLTPPPGPRGWDDLPNSTDQTRVADLVRIKYYRNVIYGHHHTMEISDIEFVRLWGKISEPLLRIATHISPAKRDEWKKSIDDLCHNPLTPDEERCIEELETWYKQDMDVKNELEKLTDTMEEKLNTLHEELTGLRSQRPVLVIQMNAESNTQTLPTQAGYHQAAGSEPMFIVLNLPEPEQVVGAGAVSPDDPGPSNPQDIDVWNVILSFKESVDLFLRYLWWKLQLLVRNDEVGSWHVTVECSSLQILEGLWDDYRSGHLNSVAQEILITPQVLEKLGLTVVKLKTFISEDQYEKGKKLFEASSGVEDRGKTQSTFQASISRATSERSIEPDEERCIEELETWYKQDMDVKNELEKLSSTMEEKLNTLHEELTWLRSQRPVFVGVEERGETQSTFQASISRATSERSIEPEKLSDLVARISRLEQENVKLKENVEANERIFQSEREKLSDLLARISRLEQENVKLKEKVEANEQIFQSERDNGNYWMSKIEKENNELKRLVEAKEHDHERRLHWLEMIGSKPKDELRQNLLSREEPYEKEPRQLQSRPRTYPGGLELKTLRELKFDTQNRVAILLENSISGAGGWREIAHRNGIRDDVVKILETKQDRGKQVMEFLEAYKPELTVHSFCEMLKEIKRFDIVKVLEDELVSD